MTLECLAEGDCVLPPGVPGTGKTLMLHRLAHALRARGRTVRMLIEGEVPAETEPGDVLLVDEADTLASAPLEALTSSRSGDGKLRLRLRTDGGEGPLEAWVYGWDGFSASGRLQGALAADGKVTLSGRLLLGRHEYECALQASLEGDRLTGEANFVRPGTGEMAKSNFSLSRS